MIDSLLHLHAEVTNSLKQTGHYDMCWKAHELAVLQELCDFLQSSLCLTDLVSSRATSLSLILIVHAEVVDACKADIRDCDELKSLKKLIQVAEEAHTKEYRQAACLDRHHPDDSYGSIN